ncbi:hypothetical protein [Paraburkholderia sp. BL10I2N1]|uniref:hypothetical protein n=1 Tax=Paraburkholderia sp. BL10I2N1 TaxID=1938796 RepID=UPI00105C0B9E|nr:hypothetical protein [Paraburkholderia sp. BL10I2N1]TDN70438.1 hypothetical protein B0G77_3912 [Paraburkholderia sp. BL10I2N1]
MSTFRNIRVFVDPNMPATFRWVNVIDGPTVGFDGEMVVAVYFGMGARNSIWVLAEWREAIEKTPLATMRIGPEHTPIETVPWTDLIAKIDALTVDAVVQLVRERMEV